MPSGDDVFRVKFKRPISQMTDFLNLRSIHLIHLMSDSLKNKMKNIKVVPNPYVATNVMEPAVSNQFLNQRRRLLFTNIPAQATIKIFTVSGILVDEINVNNPFRTRINTLGYAYSEKVLKSLLECIFIMSKRRQPETKKLESLRLLNERLFLIIRFFNFFVSLTITDDQ